MEKPTDKQIQELLETGAGVDSSAGEDGRLYSLLFSVLKQDDSRRLPGNFSSRVSARLRLQQDMRLGVKSYIIAILCGILLMVALCLALLLTRGFYTGNPLQLILAYKWLLLAGIFILTVFKIIDTRLQAILATGNNRRSL